MQKGGQIFDPATPKLSMQNEVRSLLNNYKKLSIPKDKMFANEPNNFPCKIGQIFDPTNPKNCPYKKRTRSNILSTY